MYLLLISFGTCFTAISPSTALFPTLYWEIGRAGTLLVVCMENEMHKRT